MGMEGEGKNIFKDGTQSPLSFPKEKAEVPLEKEASTIQEISPDRVEEDEVEQETGTAAQVTKDGILIPFPKNTPRDLENNNYPDPEWERRRDRIQAKKR